jgi:hypothetical protein
MEAAGIEALRVVERGTDAGPAGADAEMEAAGARPVGGVPDAGVNAAGAVQRAVDIDESELDHAARKLASPQPRTKREFVL